MANKLVARTLSCGRSTRALHARSASHARNLSVTRPHPSTRRPIIECVMCGTNNIFPLCHLLIVIMNRRVVSAFLIYRIEGFVVVLLRERVCMSLPRSDKLGRSSFLNRIPGVRLRVRETHARTVRFVARARAVVLSVSVEKPSACLGGIHACLIVLQRGTRQ